MRIISGYLKGKKIKLPKDSVTRPLKDLTKESIFNILQHSNLINFDIKKSIILDLFCGVGSFGLECISRGAKNVVFIENYLEAIEILKKNISELDCENKTKIINNNIFDRKNLDKLCNKKFEIIFLDPPYKEKRLNNLLNNILDLKLLADNGIIIIHRHKKEKEIFPIKFNILKIKTYGISKIIFGN
tara:strand:- start:102 stop:662 length:561 start_codon:yes stop_codon:yes gene_type:complete